MINSGKMIFITSLERSGSTLLDITLGKNPDLVSFGEVARVLLPHCGGGMASVVERPCSCGVLAKDCVFWGKVIERISENEVSLNLSQRYLIFLKVFEDVFGKTKVPVDSSKFKLALASLKPLTEYGLDLKVLFTVRDVRGWVVSSRRSERNRREMPYSRIFSKNIINWWRPYLRHNVLRHFPFWLPLEWYIRNFSILKLISNLGYDNHRLSYEKLNFSTESTLFDLSKFIGCKNSFSQDSPNAHIIRGNRMAFDSEKTRVIEYDSYWMSSLWSQYEAMFWPFVMSKNCQWVYFDNDKK